MEKKKSYVLMVFLFSAEYGKMWAFKIPPAPQQLQPQHLYLTEYDYNFYLVLFNSNMLQDNISLR